MPNTSQHGIGNDESEPTKIFGIVRKIEMKAALQETNGGAVGDDSFKAGVVAKAAMDARRSGTAERRGITGSACIRE